MQECDRVPTGDKPAVLVVWAVELGVHDEGTYDVCVSMRMSVGVSLFYLLCQSRFTIDGQLLLGSLGTDSLCSSLCGGPM